MSWDLEAMSVLPQKTQNEIMDNFSGELVAEKLSDYVVELEKELIELRMFRMLANDANPSIEIDITNYVNQSPRG